MQCKCGGATAPRTATHKAYTLAYQQCQACGRVGGESLTYNGSEIATGNAARVEFNNFKQGETA